MAPKVWKEKIWSTCEIFFWDTLESYKNPKRCPRLLLSIVLHRNLKYFFIATGITTYIGFYFFECEFQFFSIFSRHPKYHQIITLQQLGVLIFHTLDPAGKKVDSCCLFKNLTIIQFFYFEKLITQEKLHWAS